MPRSPLSIATRGRVNAVAKSSLTLSVIGWLLVVSMIDNQSFSGRNSTKEQQVNLLRNIQIDESDWLVMIETFLKIYSD